MKMIFEKSLKIKVTIFIFISTH